MNVSEPAMIRHPWAQECQLGGAGAWLSYILICTWSLTSQQQSNKLNLNTNIPYAVFSGSGPISMILAFTHFIFKTLSLSPVEITSLPVGLDSLEMLMIQGFGCLIPQSQPSASPPHSVSMLICLIWTMLSLWICHGWLGVGGSERCLGFIYIKLSLTSCNLIILYNTGSDTSAWVKVTSQ